MSGFFHQPVVWFLAVILVVKGILWGLTIIQAVRDNTFDVHLLPAYLFDHILKEWFVLLALAIAGWIFDTAPTTEQGLDDITRTALVALAATLHLTFIGGALAVLTKDVTKLVALYQGQPQLDQDIDSSGSPAG